MAKGCNECSDCISESSTVTEIQIQMSGTVLLDGSGNGSVVLGPVVVREYWTLTLASVSVSTSVLEATATLYLGLGLTAGRRITGTATGSSGDTAGLANLEVQPGQSIIAVFKGGDPGATANLSIVGTKDRYAK